MSEIESELTAYKIAIICIFPLRTHIDKLWSMNKQMTADWMAPKKLMIAVLEYWHGYLLLILDCKMNQEDQKRVPKINAITPIVHFSGVLVATSFTDDSWWEKLNRPFPL